MICVRCQQGIRPGEPYERHVHDRPSSGPRVNYSHRDRCPAQSAPEHPAVRNG
jgi:hypothetical protein